MFPYSADSLTVGEGEGTASAHELLEAISPFITELRKEKIARVVAGRTYDVVTVLDGIYDQGNICAVMRSAEAMGYQSMHIIETQEKFKRSSRVTQGTDKWLDVRKWKDPAKCGRWLKDAGYQLVVTDLKSAKPLDEIDFTIPTALVLGNERDGVCPELVEMADAAVIIPMDGFAQSYNISVAAAISLYHIRLERVRKLGKHASLSEEQIKTLTAEFYRRSAAHPEALLSRYRAGETGE